MKNLLEKMKNLLHKINAKIVVPIAIGAVLAVVGITALAVSLLSGGRAITEAQATTIAMEHAGVTQEDAVSLSVKEDKEDGKAVYQVEFSTQERTYECDVAKNSGEVVKYSYDQVKMFQAAQENSAENQTVEDQKKDAGQKAQESSAGEQSKSDAQKTASQNSTGTITEEEAKQIALNHAGVTAEEATLYRVKADYEDGRAVYDVEFAVGTTEYDYEIAQDTGDILGYDSDVEGWTPVTGNNQTSSQTAKAVTLEEATQLVLDRVPGATADNVRIKEDYDDGRNLFEGEVYYDRTEYEFEIDASTGTFIEWSVDYRD